MASWGIWGNRFGEGRFACLDSLLPLPLPLNDGCLGSGLWCWTMILLLSIQSAERFLIFFDTFFLFFLATGVSGFGFGGGMSISSLSSRYGKPGSFKFLFPSFFANSSERV